MQRQPPHKTLSLRQGQRQRYGHYYCRHRRTSAQSKRTCMRIRRQLSGPLLIFALKRSA